MKNYLAVMQQVLDEGVTSDDRTGTGTIKLFGTQTRYDLRKQAFPMVTTRQVWSRIAFWEMIWIAKGETNIQFLLDKNIHIWDQWALKEDAAVEGMKPDAELKEEMCALMGWDSKEFNKCFNDFGRDMDGMREYMKQKGICLSKTHIRHRKGDLGPIYGKQMARWGRGGINQLQLVIDGLRTDPNSRRQIISYWNPEDMPIPGLSPEENVLAGKAALAPCHAFVQFFTNARPLEDIIDDVIQALGDDYEQNSYPAATWKLKAISMGIPVYELSVQLYQRSVDVCVGAPTNIMGYSFLLLMVAHLVNMTPREFIHSTGDTHIYSDHVALAKEQLKRIPHKAPRIRIDTKGRKVEHVTDFVYEDFVIEGYTHEAAIKYPVAK